MGKKVVSHKSAKNVSNKRDNHKKRVVRRNIKTEPRNHWKFKNGHISHKLQKKKQKLLNKNKSNNIAQDEDEIQYIEAEKNLFDDNGNYQGKITDDKALLEWEKEEENNNIEDKPTITDIFNKMNEVNEKKLEPKVVEAYKIVGEILRNYTSGKLPKAFNILPATENWQDLLNLTEPYNWTPQAMYEAVILFSSGFQSSLAEIFYEKYLLPALRNDIKNNKKLNVHYYACLKRSLFKPAAFFKGLILPLSKNLRAREASIIGSILRRCSIPMPHASAAIMKLIQLCKDGVNNISVGALYFIRLLLLKKYSLPVQVKEELVKFFMSYYNHKNLPVMWHQLFLIFIQMYKLELNSKELDDLKKLNSNIGHHIISQEIYKEINYAKSINESHSNSNKMDIE